jgi:hypothetical protein
VAALVVAEGAEVPEATLTKAEQQDVIVLASAEPVYETIAHLVALGI